MLTESGESAGTLSALRSGAGGVIDKPVRGEQIRELAQRYEALREEPSEPSGYLVAGLVDHLDVRMLLGNDTAMVTPATHLFTRFLEPFFDESDRTSIRLGLYEILINAIEHGSLEIDFETKTKALEQEHYLHVLQERRAEPRFADRSVTVEMKVEKGACRFIVTDEGNGFDWRHWMDGFDELNIPGAHGRGILMTRFYFDEVHYNDHGNEVVLVKLMANGQP
ncbi:MAG: ATP-binding protein [Deltaproteobacteria bacterium]|nr:ATP-binding protein [Deltaproteobacteria bacterium]